MNTNTGINSDLPPLNFSQEKRVKGSEMNNQKSIGHLNLKSFSHSYKDANFANKIASELNDKVSVSLMSFNNLNFNTEFKQKTRYDSNNGC